MRDSKPTEGKSRAPSETESIILATSFMAGNGLWPRYSDPVAP